MWFGSLMLSRQSLFRGTSAARRLVKRSFGSAFRKRVAVPVPRKFACRKIAAGLVAGGAALAAGCAVFGAEKSHAASSSSWGFDSACDEIGRRLESFRATSKEVKWPKISIKKVEGDEPEPQYVFSITMEPGTRIESVLQTIMSDLAVPLYFLPPPNGQNVICLATPDLTFQVLISPKNKKIVFEKKGENLDLTHIDTIVDTYKIVNRNLSRSSSELASLGFRVYQPSSDDKDGFDRKVTWEDIAGYEGVKEEIQNTVINSLLHPEVYENIAAQTRYRHESNQPKAVLFEGPPGTGKTTVARVIAGAINVPLVYVPVESIMSMWYGESEKMLSKVFDTCEKLGKSIIFIDEIDSLATARGPNMHEATRRLLSTLLRKIEGFDRNSGVIVIGATNRKSDLDEALLSRFDVSIAFPMPNIGERKEIFRLFAKQLSESDLDKLAESASGLTGRDIRDVCAHAERTWGAAIIKNMDKNSSSSLSPTPSVDQYANSIQQRQDDIYKGSSNRRTKPPVQC